MIIIIIIIIIIVIIIIIISIVYAGKTNQWEMKSGQLKNLRLL